MARETRAGHTLDSRVWALLADAGRAAGAPITVVQGSWSGSVAASAGTHAGGGAFDLRTRDLTRAQVLALVAELRKRNVCAWWRTPEFGWPASAGGPHLHGIVRDEPGLSPGAARQVQQYDAGLNGLASHGRDPFPRPPQAPYRPGQPPAQPPAQPQPHPPKEPDVTPAEAQAMIAAATQPLADRIGHLEAQAAPLPAAVAAASAAAAQAMSEAASALRVAEQADTRSGLALYTASDGATYAGLTAGVWAEAQQYRDLPRLAAG